MTASVAGIVGSSMLVFRLVVTLVCVSVRWSLVMVYIYALVVDALQVCADRALGGLAVFEPVKVVARELTAPWKVSEI